MKKMLSSFIFISFILVISLLAVSCSDGMKGVEERGTGTVSLVAVEEKGFLESDVDKDIASYEFMATPQFALAEGEGIYGQVSTWRALTVANNAADIGIYTSGMWLFELRAKNAQGNIISVGSTNQIVRQGRDNTIPITMMMDRADGTHGESDQKGSVHIGIDLNQFDEDKENIKIVTKVQKINADGTYAAESTPFIDFMPYTAGEHYTAWRGNAEEIVPAGVMYYEGVLANQEAGAYIYRIYVQAKNTQDAFITIAGQTLDVRVIGGEETVVKGELLANQYMEGSLQIKAPNLEVGTMKSGNTTSTCFVGNLAAPTVLKYVPNENSTEAIERYQWFVNGILQEEEETANFSFSCPMEGDIPEYGVYTITCTVMGELGSVVSTTVLINYAHTTGPMAEFDWGEDALADPTLYYIPLQSGMTTDAQRVNGRYTETTPTKFQYKNYQTQAIVPTLDLSKKKVAVGIQIQTGGFENNIAYVGFLNLEKQGSQYVARIEEALDCYIMESVPPQDDYIQIMASGCNAIIDIVFDSTGVNITWEDDYGNNRDFNKIGFLICDEKETINNAQFLWTSYADLENLIDEQSHERYTVSEYINKFATLERVNY